MIARSSSWAAFGREEVVVGEPDEPLRVARDDAGERLVAAARREADPADAVLVQLGQPAVGLLLGGPGLGLRLGEVPGEPPGGAVLLGLLAQVAGLLVGGAAGLVEPGAAAGGGHRGIASDREVTVEVDDVEILEHGHHLVGADLQEGGVLGAVEGQIDGPPVPA